MNDTPTPRADAQARHYDSLIAHIEANSSRHPWYGPCDAMGDNGSCYECDKIIARVRDLERQLAEATREIDILRRYGNKDCTAMADEELASIRQPLPNPPTV